MKSDPASPSHAGVAAGTRLILLDTVEAALLGFPPPDSDVSKLSARHIGHGRI